MASKIEDLGGSKVKIAISVDGKRLEESINKVYLKQRGKFNVPGFRRGKAPRIMIENHYGPTVFFEDAFSDLYPEVYREAVEEHELAVVSDPENLQMDDVDLKEGISFSVDVYVKPPVTLGKYEGLTVKRPSAVVSDEDVDAEINKIREQNARWVEVDRAVVEGDTVVMDYSGSVDGELFDGGTAENQSLEIGSKRFIPGFEDQLVGMNKGDEKDINVTFPDNYAPELAGKDAVFAIKLREVKEKELPELDDDFAQDVSEHETMDEYRQHTRETLEKQINERADIAVENRLVEAVAEGTAVDIPDVMVENAIDGEMQQLSYQLMYQGMKLEDYLEYSGKSMEEFRDGYREGAARNVKMRLTVGELIEQLKIDPTDEEAEEELAKVAEEAGKTPEEYRKLAGIEDLGYFKDRIAMERVIDHLKAHATIEQEEPPKEDGKSKEAKPKAKATAKKAKSAADAGEDKPKAAKPKAAKAKVKEDKAEVVEKAADKKDDKKEDVNE